MLDSKIDFYEVLQLSPRANSAMVEEAVPSLADFLQLAWLYDQGYRNMMICDEICLKEDLLSTAVNVFQSFRESYTGNPGRISELVKPRSRRLFSFNLTRPTK